MNGGFVLLICLFLAFIGSEQSSEMNVLGKPLTPKARDFLIKQTELLGDIDFRNITEHRSPFTRKIDGCHELTNNRHIVWLKPENKDFETCLMHEVMHGVLDYRGYPVTKRPDKLQDDEQAYQIGSILMSVIQNVIIDDQLTKDGLVVFDREQAVQSKYSEAYSDFQYAKGKIVPNDFYYCKWALLTFSLIADRTFTKDQKYYLSSYIKKKFPEAYEAGFKLGEEIIINAHTEPSEALSSMIMLRNSLKLQERVYVVDHKGNVY